MQSTSLPVGQPIHTHIHEQTKTKPPSRRITQPGTHSPIRHGTNRPKRNYQRPVGIGAPVLPTAERRHEIALRSIRFGYNGRQASVCEQRVGRTTDTDGIAGSGVGERPPLGAFVDGVRLQHQAALGTHHVSGRMDDHHLRGLAALGTHRLIHRHKALRSPASSLADLLCFLCWVGLGWVVLLLVRRLTLLQNSERGRASVRLLPPLVYLCVAAACKVLGVWCGDDAAGEINVAGVWPIYFRSQLNHSLGPTGCQRDEEELPLLLRVGREGDDNGFPRHFATSLLHKI